MNDATALPAKTQPLSLSLLLDAAESDCCSYLEKHFDPARLRSIAEIEKLMNDDIGKVERQHCVLLINIILLKQEIETDTSREEFGCRIYLLATLAIRLMIEPSVKYFDTGIKVRAGFEKGLGTENIFRKRQAKESHEEIRENFRKLQDAGVKRHKLVSEHLKQYGSPSESKLRRVLKTL